MASRGIERGELEAVAHEGFLRYRRFRWFKIALAISLLHSYANPGHEKRVEAIAACHETNMRNAPKRKDCASGYPGVSLYKPTGKWQARIGVNRTNSDGRISLGHFATFEEAVAARQAAETEYGYLTARPF